jgi:hypothetical protein
LPATGWYYFKRGSHEQGYDCGRPIFGAVPDARFRGDDGLHGRKENMGKSAAMMSTGQTAANKEMAMANMDMSNGKMRSACMRYMKAQKISMMK